MGTALAPSNPSPGRLTPLWSVLHTRLVSKIPSDRKALQPKAVIPSSRQIRPKDVKEHSCPPQVQEKEGVRQRVCVCMCVHVCARAYAGGQGFSGCLLQHLGFPLNTQLQGGLATLGGTRTRLCLSPSHSSPSCVLHPVLLEATCQAGQVRA